MRVARPMRSWMAMRIHASLGTISCLALLFGPHPAHARSVQPDPTPTASAEATPQGATVSATAPPHTAVKRRPVDPAKQAAEHARLAAKYQRMAASEYHRVARKYAREASREKRMAKRADNLAKRYQRLAARRPPRSRAG
jgi:hypothetical protein